MELPRIALCQLPTPCHRLEGFGADLWIKRDDLTGFAGGGNKGRKLEYLMPKILASGAEVVVTCGAEQSNFIRQLAAACAIHGIECHAVVMPLPYEPPAEPPIERLPSLPGNLLLNEFFGLRLVRLTNGTWDELFAAMEDHAKSLERRTMIIPLGGSSPYGAFGFYRAAAELTEEFDYVVIPTSSGSTQVGLATAFAGTRTKVLGICCDPEPEIAHDFAKLSTELSELTGLPQVSAAEFTITTDYVGPGYGVPSEAGISALKMVAKGTGIILDPIYSSKAMAGLLDLLSKGELSGKILFWHTGGFPSVFGYPRL